MPHPALRPGGARSRTLAWGTLAMALAGGLAGGSPAVADDDLTVQGKFGETVENDNNPLLLASGVKPATGSVSSPEAIVNGDSQTAHADLDSRLDFNEYNLKGFSSTDLHTLYHTSYKGEVTSFGLNGGFDYDTTRTSELTNTGVNIAGIRHTGLTLSPQAGYGITPADQLFLNGSFQRSAYGNTLFYTNYDFYTLSPSFQHTFDPLNTGVVSINATEFRTASGINVGVDTIGPMVGWVRTLSETFSVTAAVGFQRSVNHVPAVIIGSTPGTWNYVYNFDLGYRDQQDTVHLTSSRNSAPEDNGSEAFVTAFGLTETHTVTTRLDGEISFQYQFQSYSRAVTGVSQDYLSVEPAMSYHLTEDLAVVPSYRYRRQDTLGISTPQSSSSVMIRLVYTPTRWSLGL